MAFLYKHFKAANACKKFLLTNKTLCAAHKIDAVAFQG